jgi:DNA-binding response OmpR family regulator
MVWLRSEKILLVDDEQGILDILMLLLHKEGFQEIRTATTGEQALSIIKNSKLDLILLDVALPDIDGFQLCSQIRLYTQIPILFVSARSSDLDKLTGLGIGGDDYITKPFNPLEVMARINAQLRRQNVYKEYAQTKFNTIWDYGSLVIYQDEGRIVVKGEEILHTAKEFELLTFLCKHPNRIFTTNQLYENVWGFSYIGDEKTVVMHISKLRKKIELNPKKPKIIVNLRGLGYKFIPPNRGNQ